MLDPIRHEVALTGVHPARAFAAYVDLGAWWPAEYTPDAAGFVGGRIEPWAGGRVVFETDSLGEVEWGRVLEADDGTTADAATARLVHTSTLAQPPDVPSTVTLEFDAADAGTVLRFAHGGWRDGDADLRAKFGDWPVILARYAAWARSR